jgi:UDP-glucose 4-epimerase
LVIRIKKPDLYQRVNVGGTRNLLDGMHTAGVKKIVFSSSAATYGEPAVIPIKENAQPSPTNPYGATKLEIDKYLEKNAKSLGLSSICFRFFNIGGALKTKKGNWLKIKHEECLE